MGEKVDVTDQLSVASEDVREFYAGESVDYVLPELLLHGSLQAQRRAIKEHLPHVPSRALHAHELTERRLNDPNTRTFPVFSQDGEIHPDLSGFVFESMRWMDLKTHEFWFNEALENYYLEKIGGVQEGRVSRRRMREAKQWKMVEATNIEQAETLFETYVHAWKRRYKNVSNPWMRVIIQPKERLRKVNPWLLSRLAFSQNHFERCSSLAWEVFESISDRGEKVAKRLYHARVGLEDSDVLRVLGGNDESLLAFERFLQSTSPVPGVRPDWKEGLEHLVIGRMRTSGFVVEGMVNSLGEFRFLFDYIAEPPYSDRPAYLARELVRELRAVT